MEIVGPALSGCMLETVFIWIVPPAAPKHSTAFEKPFNTNSQWMVGWLVGSALPSITEQVRCTKGAFQLRVKKQTHTINDS